MHYVFMFANLLVLPVWASMIAAPSSRWTGRLLATPWFALPLIGLYAALIVPNLASVLPVVARPELPAVARLLGSPVGAAAGFIHFLTFDLLVGRWIVLDARERAVPRWLLSLTLALTLLLAPLGLGLYFALRAGLPGRAWSAMQLAVRAAYRGSAPLTALGVVSGLTGVVAGALQFVDPRQALGVSVWLKPTKFGVSIAIASFTLAWLLPAIEISASRKRRAERTISAGLLLELVIINLQSARGVASHFNYTSALNSALGVTMGVAIVVVTIEIGVIGWQAFRTRYTNLALGAGIRSGFALVILGSLLAFLMTSPTAKQLASLRRGQPTPLIGGHSVGANDATSGSPGEATSAMPLTGWSDAGGDLRVPHFIGLHALQIMPLLGFWLSRRRRVSAQQAHALTRIAAWGYLGLIATTLVQALRARPLLAPDALTCALAAGVAISCALAAASVWLRSRERSAARATWQLL